MTPERRYDDDEMAEIFNRATRVDASRSTHTTPSEVGEGMTLAELQEIGAEAGIDPALVAQAAASLRVRAPDAAPVRRFGVPLSVHRSVDLPARLTDEEWDRLVVRLREVFQAKGVVRREGSLHSWANGNLQILMEPTADGYRLRMRTLSQQIQGRVTGGALMIVGGVSITLFMTLFSMLGLAGGVSFRELLPLLIATLAGTVLFRSGSVRSATWSERRASQFEEIGAMAVAMAAERLRLEPPG